jgi:OmpA-OmpF porin, OOP family
MAIGKSSGEAWRFAVFFSVLSLAAGFAGYSAAQAPAPKPATFTVTLAADESFEPGAGPRLTPAGKAKLDGEVVTKAKELARVDLIVVSGHSDRLGDVADNQRLSEERAEAVLEYLKSQRVEAPFMDAMGFGQTLPVKQCTGEMPKGELAACLGPNRRIVVEVKGIPR